MQIQVLTAQNYKTMPWRNGKGITREIAIDPPTSTLAENNFRWRLSSADVNEDGVFSQFPGCQRFLTLLTGSGLELKFENEVQVLEQGAYALFSGDRKVDGRLRGGKVTDLNFIFKEEQAHAQFVVSKEASGRLAMTTGTLLVFVATGAVDLTVDLPVDLTVDLPVDLTEDGRTDHLIDAQETAIITVSTNEVFRFMITPRKRDSRYIIIRIENPF